MSGLTVTVPILVLMSTFTLAQNHRVDVTFSPQEKKPAFVAAVGEYRGIWSAGTGPHH